MKTNQSMSEVNEPMWFVKVRKGNIVRDLTRAVSTITMSEPTKLYRKVVVIYNNVNL